MNNTAEIQIYSLGMAARKGGHEWGITSAICYARSLEEAYSIASTEARKRLPERDGWRDHITHAQVCLSFLGVPPEGGTA